MNRLPIHPVLLAMAWLATGVVAEAQVTPTDATPPAVPAPAPVAAAPVDSPLAKAAAQAERDLAASLEQLATLRASIQAEKVPMSQELSALEARLAGLRRDAESQSRARDERALDVGNLGQAVKLRQDEMNYVSNLFDEYARGFEAAMHVSEMQRWTTRVSEARLARENKDLSMTEKFRHQVELVQASIDRAVDLLGGLAFDGEAVDPAGLVANGRFTLVGPVALFASAASGAAGLALPQSGSSLAAVRPLEKALNGGVAAVVATGEGLLPFDPSLGGALKELVHRGSLLHYFVRGGPIMWPLLFVSMLALTVILERLFFLARERKRRDAALVETILRKVGEGDVVGAIRAGEKTQDFVARSLTYSLRHREKSLSNALMRSSAQELVRFTRGISILDTCITVAPLLGLLGTVTGMMGSFGMLGGGELSAPAQITGGIAEALIATCFGLGIAVTALIPMNFLHSRSDAARHEMEDAATHLELLMKPILDAEAAAARERMMAIHGPAAQPSPAAGSATTGNGTPSIETHPGARPTVSATI
ncbi:MAG TPA: MotA/TolQ/ExbB proton channel family protein [Candidatus Polarisedimenticolia bacterium]|nr:MotA/TolQ/ExbB proton channel family protein [Candidatus Polarisedimenticolia bacterium]